MPRAATLLVLAVLGALVTAVAAGLDLPGWMAAVFGLVAGAAADPLGALFDDPPPPPVKATPKRPAAPSAPPVAAHTPVAPPIAAAAPANTAPRWEPSPPEPQLDPAIGGALGRIAWLAERLNAATTRSSDSAGSMRTWSVDARGKAAAVRSAAELSLVDSRASAEKIRGATAIIRHVAFETKILSINAAIEAARAGEHGRTFAIIAQSVQALAAQVEDASSTIDEFVASYQNASRSTATAIESAATAIDDNAETFTRVAAEVDGMQAAARTQLADLCDMNAEINRLRNLGIEMVLPAEASQGNRAASGQDSTTLFF